jgi:FG-GAP-like repeat
MIRLSGQRKALSAARCRSLACEPLEDRNMLSFIVQNPVPVTGVNPAVVATADLFNHGQADLAVTNVTLGAPNGSVTIYENTTTSAVGDITFAQTQDIPVGADPIGVIAGRFTGDGLTDLVVADAGDGTIAVLLNDPNNPGTFQTPMYYTVGGNPFSVVVGQFTASGHQDILVGTSNSLLGTSTDTVSLLFGNGDGTFQAPVQIKTGASGGQDVAAAPFSVGGNYNIVVANYDTNNISVLFGNGDGTFQPPVLYPVGTKPYTVAVGDVNGDGHADIITSNQDDGTVSVLLNDGTDNFPSRTDYPVGGMPADVVLGNFHGDSQVDIAVTNYLVIGGSVSVLLNNGDGTFAAATQYTTGSLAAGVAVNDYNGDGFPDMVVANAGSGTLSILRNDTMQPDPPPGGSAATDPLPQAPGKATTAHHADAIAIFASSELRRSLVDEVSLLVLHGKSIGNTAEAALLTDFAHEWSEGNGFLTWY